MNKTFIILLSGIAIGIFLAPGEGSETLKRVTDRITGLKKQLKESADKICETQKADDKQPVSEAK
jgi:hypothetical protein